MNQDNATATLEEEDPLARDTRMTTLGDDGDGPSLEDVDVDGALREAAQEATVTLDEEQDTRSAFLRRAGLAGGALVGGGVALGALAPDALAHGRGYHTRYHHRKSRPPRKLFGRGDVAILRYALLLEYLEFDFYNQALKLERDHSFLSEKERVFLRTVRHDEKRHVLFLRKALGHKAIKRPKFNYHGDNAKRGSFLKAAFAFENLGVQAYHGQAFNLKHPGYLEAALSIVTVEARHASVVGLLLKGNQRGIAPSGAFDEGAGGRQVVKVVEGLNYIVRL
jgi:rubrerythrin